MMLVNLITREISPGLGGGDDVSAWTRLRGLLDLGLDLVLDFLSRNGGFMVISLELV
jgi:hypothetical protein